MCVLYGLVVSVAIVTPSSLNATLATPEVSAPEIIGSTDVTSTATAAPEITELSAGVVNVSVGAVMSAVKDAEAVVNVGVFEIRARFPAASFVLIAV